MRVLSKGNEIRAIFVPCTSNDLRDRNSNYVIVLNIYIYIYIIRRESLYAAVASTGNDNDVSNA